MRKAVVVAVGAALWASTAQAADVKLVPIGPGAGGAPWGFVDRANVETAGVMRTYWALSVNTAKEAAMSGHIYYAMRRYLTDNIVHEAGAGGFRLAGVIDDHLFGGQI